MTNVKSTTKPTLRQRQAQATRSLIVNTAQALFLEQGYVNTTIETIAAHAGVAVSTVYAVFGSKRGILKAIREAWHGQSHIRDVTYGAPLQESVEERIDRLARATRLQWETGSPVVTIYKDAAASDPQAAAELAEALAGRRRGMEKFAQSLEPHLRKDVGVERAAAILQALCQPEMFDDLVRRSGWTPEGYQAWLAQILKRELLG